MKVLMLTPYVTLKGHPEFMRNQTGFGYMVMDIALAMARTEDVELLASDSRGEDFNFEHIHFLKRSWGAFLRNIRQCLPLSFVWSLRRTYKMQSGTLLRLLYCWMISGYYNYVIKKGGYDVVHIHGCCFVTELWMEVCNRCGQKFVVTLHGLNSFSDTVKLELAGKQYERDFLKRVSDGELPITVISTGMKRLIEQSYCISDCNNITVVCNSFNLSSDTSNLLVRKKYGIPNDAKVILYVGNISQNKNQTQMVRAFDLLPEDTKGKTWVLFCGNNHAEDGVLENLIQKSDYSNHLILCGGVEKALMPAFYWAADGVALLSNAEGFGLSLIEGMYFGLPCMMFRDMDAFEDIYNADAVVPIDTRDDVVVASAMETLISNKWNKDRIVSLSKRFDSISMSEKYKRVYELL